MLLSVLDHVNDNGQIRKIPADPSFGQDKPILEKPVSQAPAARSRGSRRRSGLTKSSIAYKAMSYAARAITYGTIPAAAQ